MLDLSQEEDAIAVAWESVALAPVLPETMNDFFDQHGAIPSRAGCRRAYSRFYLRGRAILRHGDDNFGVFTADASRQGIRFLSPIVLELKKRYRIRLPKTKEFQIEIVRCNRLGEQCFDCGAQFVLGVTAS
jgi:hypothetical protein